MLLTVRNWLRIILVALLAASFWSCASMPRTAPRQTAPPDSSPPLQTPSTGKERTVPSEQQANPRALASLQLTEQGKMLLDQRRPDDAIRVLERAIQLNPATGHNYYYLSEAWLMKGNLDQAREFNDLARIYFSDNPTWTARVENQRQRLDRDSSGGD